MMSVLEYADDINKTVGEVLKQCKVLNIKVSSEEDMLNDEEITELDSTFATDDDNLEDNLDEIIFSLGQKVAIFHEASRFFNPTKNFVRPVYSIDSLELASHNLKYGIEIGLFNNDQYELMKKVIDKVKSPQINNK